MHQTLKTDAARLGRLVGTFGLEVQRVLRVYHEGVLERQYQLARIADTATELYVCGCVLRRLDRTLTRSPQGTADGDFELATGRYYLRTAQRRIRHNLAALWSNDDAQTTTLADLALSQYKVPDLR